jgi:hypothetical protein
MTMPNRDRFALTRHACGMELIGIVLFVVVGLLKKILGIPD